MVVTAAPAGMHKITSYPLDMTNRFVSLSLLLDKLRLIALKNQLHHGTLIRLSLTSELCTWLLLYNKQDSLLRWSMLPGNHRFFWGENTEQTLLSHILRINDDSI